MSNDPDFSNLNVAIVNYGMGNIGSVANALEYFGCAITITQDSGELASADAIVLPGVGAFPAAINNLKKRSLFEPIKVLLAGDGIPFLGICLGMQLLASRSIEIEPTDGLNLIDAEVVDIPKNTGLPIPHVGWNNISLKNCSAIFAGIPDNADFYFDHSFHLVADEEIVTSTVDYGTPLVSSIQKENIFATQFHPEKSQILGLRLFKNFLLYALDRKKQSC